MGSRARMRSAGASSSSHRLNSDPTSFLFVVNKLDVQYDENSLSGDPWFNRVPPTRPSGFNREITGCVMRYQYGQVTEAHGYRWWRGDPQETAWPPGNVYLYDADGNTIVTDGGQPAYAPKYKELAVFSCNPLLPIVVDNGDPLSANAALDRSPLLFFHPPSQPGVSQAVHPDSPMGPGPAPCKYVAGASPSWIPSLVPKTYRNPNSHAARSVGLAGELPIVLGLMAFSEPVDEGGNWAIRTFLRDGISHGRWNGGRWHHAAAPQGYVLSTADDPQGFFISVHLDPNNPEYSNEEYLREMEWNGIIVQDHVRS